MASEMTTAEVRDKVAGLDGWTTYTASNGVIVWERGAIDDGTYETRTDHPIPDTLDACAAAWDRHAGEHGWWWIKKNRLGGGTVTIGEWTADSLTQQVTVDPSGTDAAAELRDRWELLGLVLKARGVV